MSLIDNAKEIADLIKKIGDIELYRKIVRLEEEIIDLTRAKRQADQKVEELQATLTTKQGMRFEDPFFVDSIHNRKCCPHCWQTNQKVVYLVGGRDNDGDTMLKCAACRTNYYQQAHSNGWRVISPHS